MKKEFDRFYKFSSGNRKKKKPSKDNSGQLGLATKFTVPPKHPGAQEWQGVATYLILASLEAPAASDP